MDRRVFLTGIIATAISPIILPSAKTYTRIWKEIVREDIFYKINPAYMTVEYELVYRHDYGMWTQVILNKNEILANCGNIKRIPYSMRFNSQMKYIHPEIKL